MKTVTLIISSLFILMTVSLSAQQHGPQHRGQRGSSAGTRARCRGRAPFSPWQRCAGCGCAHRRQTEDRKCAGWNQTTCTG